MASMVTVVAKFTDGTVFAQDFSTGNRIWANITDTSIKILIEGQIVLFSPLKNIEYYFIKEKNKTRIL